MTYLEQSRSGQGGTAAVLRSIAGAWMQIIRRHWSEAHRSKTLQDPELAIVERLSLGGGKTVTLIEVGGRRFIIAAGTEAIHSFVPVHDDRHGVLSSERGMP